MVTELTLFNELRQKVAFFVQKLSFNSLINTKGRKLTLTDILSLAIFKHTGQITTKKELWQIFEPACSYKTLVVNVNRFFHLVLIILFLLLKTNRSNGHPVKHIDSTDIPVCSLRKDKHHRAMKTLVHFGKTGKGWFYGLKLHLIADLEKRILAVQFTSGNTNDRAVVLELASDLLVFLWLMLAMSLTHWHKNFTKNTLRFCSQNLVLT